VLTVPGEIENAELRLEHIIRDKVEMNSINQEQWRKSVGRPVLRVRIGVVSG
jgi:hypothetical protein